MSLLPRQQRAPDDRGDTRLTTFVRFNDLAGAGIVRNWETLRRLIDKDGFPAGVMLGRNTRAWPLDAVETWLAERPTARKAVPKAPGRKRQIRARGRGRGLVRRAAAEPAQSRTAN
jgi:hypothetical protein